MEYQYQETLKITPPKEANFAMEMGDDPLSCWRFCFVVHKTLPNKLKYWLFCKFFPFRVVKWEKEE